MTSYTSKRIVVLDPITGERARTVSADKGKTKLIGTLSKIITTFYGPLAGPYCSTVLRIKKVPGKGHFFYTYTLANL